jgi:acetoin utilization protein AcuB
MRVRDWMSPDPVTVTPLTSVQNARRILRAQGIRHLPVVTGDPAQPRVVGMLSDRDLIASDRGRTAAVAGLQSDLLSGRYRRVEAIMSSPVKAVRLLDPITVAARTMLHWGISAVVVIDHGRLVGILTTSDCLQALMHEQDKHLRIEFDPDWNKSVPLGPGDPRPGRAPSEVYVG